MNILFYSYFKPVPTFGGIERVTDIVAKGLTQLSYKCFVLYEEDVPGNCNNCFISSTVIPKEDRCCFLKDYILSNAINIVVVQGKREVLPIFRGVMNEVNCRLIYALHSDPGYGYDTFNVDTLKYEIAQSKGLVKLYKLLILALFPLYKFRNKKALSESYKKAYSLVDKFVLLSEAAIPYFLKLSGIKDTSKIKVISNPVTYDNSLPVSEYDNKEKKVLIVSRMEEHSKKISLALKAWKRVERDPTMNQWSLDIVGDGADLNTYRKWVKRNGIKRVEFHGYQSPEPFYKRSSVFLMTSVSEAWGMSIIEAQQQMCVPVAFDSYCALKDIIKNNENGILVKYPSVKDFADSICYISNQSEIRKRIAMSGRIATEFFSKENIVQKWNQMFAEVI